MMAEPHKRLSGNVPGNFFVDSSCIDCDQCRQIAPLVFHEEGETSIVYHQPVNPQETRRAEMALLACPTASIGMTQKHDLKEAIQAFPEEIAQNVYFCGFTSEASFGASSYLLVRPEGNILIDSPRWNAPLVRQMEAKGGVALMFLSHGDDVADHAKFQKHFRCERIMHQRDIQKGTSSVERKIQGKHPIQIGENLWVIPTPGHTQGHQVLLYQNRYLFSGDHLWWREVKGALFASKRYCWYSWSEQIKSMEQLLEFRFEWVFPGHGHRHHAPAHTMHQSLQACIASMKRA